MHSGNSISLYIAVGCNIYFVWVNVDVGRGFIIIVIVTTIDHQNKSYHLFISRDLPILIFINIFHSAVYMTYIL